jgi:hypothetical protein
LLLLGAAIGWVVVRPVVSGTLAKVGVVKVAYLGVLTLALAVTALLVADPDLLQKYAPGWRGTMGLVLLCASVLSMSIALARVIKAAVFFAVWACVSLVLASELFLGKLPQDILREDVRRIQSLLPESVLQGVVEKLEGEAVAGSSESSFSTGDKLRAFVLSGSPAVGYEGSNSSFAGELNALLSSYGIDMSVKDLTSPGATVYDIRDVAGQALTQEKPDLVFIVGWSSDARVGRNSLGVPGLTEQQAREQRARYRSLASYPLVADVLTSRLYRFMTGQIESTGHQDTVTRVSVEEYKAQLREVVGEFQGAGATVVLVSEPTDVRPEEEGYRKVLEELAQQSGAVYVNAQDALQTRSSGVDRDLIARGRLLSDEGVAALTEAAFHRTAQVLIESDKPSQLAQALSRSFPRPEVLQHEYQLAGLRGESVSMVVNPRETAGDLLFKLRHMDSNRGYYRVVFSVNGTFVADRRLNDRESTRVRFRIPEQFMSLPFVELSVRTVASPGREEDRIGSSEVAVPVPIAVSASNDALPLSSVRVAGQVALRTQEPFAATAVDPNSGEVLESLATRQPEVLERWLKSQPWGAIVAGASSGEALSADVSHYLGIERGQRVFLGVAGSKTAALNGDTRQQALSLGSSVVRNMNRFVLEGATVESSGKALLGGSGGA